MNPLKLTFDVGHSSIGWAVLDIPSGRSTKLGDPTIVGCGSVIFRADDCLASSRRAYRRQRRHIRATRQRIARMKIALAHLGVLTPAQLDENNCAWPWLLAARVLQGGKALSWSELWSVLRWYAHNRGYDGNRRWSAVEFAAQEEDTEKVENARELTAKYGTSSMAETFCAMSKLDPRGNKKSTNLPGDQRPKGQNAAFPREMVESEVWKILRFHEGKLKGVDANLEKALFSDWRAIDCPALKLPRRFEGGLLFGQIVPRFDNRIISDCPITGKKVPSRNCEEFLNCRWGLQLANIKTGKRSDRELRPLIAEHRMALDKLMRERGYLTPKELKETVRKLTGCERDNLDTMLMHPDAKEALLLDPVQKVITSEDFFPFWKTLPERLQKRLRGQWRRGKAFSLQSIRTQLEQLGDAAAFDAELLKQLDARISKTAKGGKQTTKEELLQRHFPSKSIKLTGRAAYERDLLQQAYDDVLAGKGHPKEEGGCLFITPEIREAQINRTIAEQTNNHLVRHRLLILERLLKDIVAEYAGGDQNRVAKITIEVNRDLREMSGKTVKEKAQLLGQQVANHHSVSEKLEEALEGKKINARPIPITAGLIRKARVADDLGWTCPYTGHKYEPINLVTRYVDKDHIIPRSQRLSDGLDSLVVTFAEINKWKANRTACQFISEEQGKSVPGLPNLSILTLTRYKAFVESLEAFKGHDDDKRRKKKRKELMLLPKYEEKEFTPRDLTQTSQLVRLGAQVVRKNLPHLTSGDVVSIPGSVTGTVRKAWRVLGCLQSANPQVLEENGEVKNKGAIRDISHLHHALDACVLGLVSHFIPNNGRVWQLIQKRNLDASEKRDLAALGVFDFNGENRFELRDLPPALKEQISQRLAENRVVQHIPARMDGLRAEQNTWRVVAVNNGEVTLRQRMRQPDGTRSKKETEEKAAKLVGPEPRDGVGKLLKNKGALVIPDNYGVALDPTPTIIPFHKVWTRLRDLKTANRGKTPRVIRNGQLIHVPEGRYKGTWRVFSAKNNATGIALDIGSPDVVRLKNKTPGHKINVSLASLLANGMYPLKAPLTGIAAGQAGKPASANERDGRTARPSDASPTEGI